MTCRWTSTTTPRVLPDRHLPACMDDCLGCQPCEQAHCLRCGVTHDDHVCPACLASVRLDLAEIVQYHGELAEEIEVRGIQSEAMNLAGPCADPEARGHLEASVAVGRVPADRLEEALPRDERHPLWVLETWAGIWREELEHDDPVTVATVGGAARYLDANLTDMARRPHVEFAQFASEVAACSGHLAGVLHDRASRQKGAPCPTCDPARVLILDGEWWTCMGCRESWDEDRYRSMVRAGYLQKAEWLSGPDCAEVVGVPAGSVRGWASKGLVEKKQHEGRVLYRVAMVKAMKEAA